MKAFLSSLNRGLLLCAAVSSVGCKSLTDVPPLPAGTQDINSFFNREGAIAFYNTVVGNFARTMATSALSGGVFADELHGSELLGNTDLITANTTFKQSSYVQADARRLVEGVESSIFNDVVSGDPWMLLHAMRADAMQALGIFTEYTTEPSVFRGHLYAILGYAELQLADLFCSGIPLSTVDFKKDWTYRAGSTTEEVYRHAVALFDTAIMLSADSTRILNLARVGKGRALLALGQYTDAAAAVSDVPADYRYQQPLTWRRTVNSFTGKVTMTDREGGVGLPYISARDPRIDTGFVATNPFGRRLYLPKKYPLNAQSQFVIADGVEAMLIVAEAKLSDKHYGEWLGVLNTLRQTAIVPALSALPDPGTDAARIDTLFKERAFWLYLTGHRLGDMRRLVRQYHRIANTVYPFGGYPGWAGEYGSDVVLPINKRFEQANPLFQGCLDYEA